jgi:hypothetical protein
MLREIEIPENIKQPLAPVLVTTRKFCTLKVTCVNIQI